MTEPWHRLKEIVARLRRECPWDREQTLSSLKRNFLEECYEVLEALEQENSDKLQEELGDLLCLILFFSELADEAGWFNINDVLSDVCDKLVRRHPHVFGEAKLQNSEQVLKQWHRLKQEETSGSILDGVPQSLPSLAYSQEIQERAAQIGFDWPGVEEVFEKLTEEIKELSCASPEKQASEFGDLLFTLVNIARKQGIDTEAALRQTAQKFYRRFVYMEQQCRLRGADFASLPLSEKDHLWEEAKKVIP